MQCARGHQADALTSEAIRIDDAVNRVSLHEPATHSLCPRLAETPSTFSGQGRPSPQRSGGVLAATIAGFLEGRKRDYQCGGSQHQEIRFAGRISAVNPADDFFVCAIVPYAVLAYMLGLLLRTGIAWLVA